MFLDNSAPPPLRPNILQVLTNTTTVPPVSTIQVTAKGMRTNVQKYATYTHICKSCLPCPFLSYAVFAMDKLYEWIIGASALYAINNRFLLMNDVGLSFGMLSSVKLLYENLDWTILLVDTT